MKTYLLKDLLKIRNGKDHKHLAGGAFPVYGSGGLMRYVNQYIYNQESILLPRKGTLSNIQYTDQPFWSVDTLYYTIINKDLCNPYFLYNYLISLNLENLNSGTGVPSMTFDSYYSLKIKLPSLNVQNKVAEKIAAISNKIEINNQINDNLEQMAKAIYDYWFVQFDFPNENGRPYKSSGGKMVYNEELKREIPEGWAIKGFLEFVRLGSGGTPKSQVEKYWMDGDIPFYTPRDYKNSYYVNDTLQKITKSGLDSCSSKLYPKNTIFFTARGTVGKVNLITRPMALNQSCYAFQETPELNYCYLHQLVLNIVEIMKAKANGSIFDAVVTNDFKTISIATPDLSLINAYKKTVINLYILKSNIIQQNQELAQLRDWLLPMLMNGQVTVK